LVVEILVSAGDHVPVIKLVEVVGKAVKVPPEQIAGTAVKLGVTGELTVIIIIAAVAHCVTPGVNV
jgi:hypothetical protein